jgi:PelA/Pel-15E family pectate lyase
VATHTLAPYLVVAAILLQTPSAVTVSWNAVLRQPDAWYATAEARTVADRVLLYQRQAGGWPKDIDMTVLPAPVPGVPAPRPDSTIDNGATTTQIRLLARVSAAGGRDPRYQDAILRGLDYLFSAQYANGGWPQFFPLRTDYSRYITFNDNAMINVMTLLDEVADGRAPFEAIDQSRRARAREAVRKGVDVVVRTQIRVNGELTAWCAQYDERSLEPGSARTYEHTSLSGMETVGIVRFLMSRPEQTPSIVAAIEAAVSWLRRVAIPGQRLERRPDSSLPRGYDVVVVADPAAPPLWARFYQIGSNRPIFSGRDGVIRAELREIEHERRVGYAWLGTWPESLLEKDYPAWRSRFTP